MQQKLSGETSRVPPRHIHDTQQQHARLVGHQQDDRCVVCGARFGPRCDSTVHAAREGGGQQCHEPAKQHHQNQIASDECQRLRFQSGCERLLSVGEHGRWHGRATIDTDSRDNGRVSYAITSGKWVRRLLLGRRHRYPGCDPPTGSRVSKRVCAQRLGDRLRPSGNAELLTTYSHSSGGRQRPFFMQSLYEASEPENSPPGTFVLIVSATDKDVGTNGNFTYLIQDGTFAAVDLYTGSVVTLAPLDREKKANYVVSVYDVYVGDDSFPAKYDTTTIVIQVLDVNDHSPEFGECCYPLYVPENSDLSVIQTVVATDAEMWILGPTATSRKASRVVTWATSLASTWLAHGPNVESSPRSRSQGPLLSHHRSAGERHAESTPAGILQHHRHCRRREWQKSAHHVEPL